MKTKLRIVKFDVTHFWNEEFRNEYNTGGITDYCLYDANEITHCCEITPSYWIIPVHTETENFISDDGFSELLINNDHDPLYVHCSDVEKLPSEDQPELDFEYKTEEEKAERMEEIEELFHCNAPYFV